MRVLGMISGTSADAIEVVGCHIDGAPPRVEVRVLGARSVAASVRRADRRCQPRMEDEPST